MRVPILISALIGLLVLSSPVAADECYADYKAKQDSPLRLHYGVMQLTGPCNPGAARGEVAQRLTQRGWTLLNVMSVFGAEGLNKRKADAGPYYLRF